jgi:hypothetical protein
MRNNPANIVGSDVGCLGNRKNGSKFKVQCSKLEEQVGFEILDLPRGHHGPTGSFGDDIGGPFGDDRRESILG